MFRFLTLLLFTCGVSLAELPTTEEHTAKVREDYQMCVGGYLPDLVWVKESAVQWNHETDKIPLAAPEASQIAIRKLSNHLANYKEMNMNASNVRLNQVRDGNWCYTMLVSCRPKDQPFGVDTIWACVHVRMDSEARVEKTPMITPEPEGLLRDSDKKIDQGGADQPAPESKSGGIVKPQPELEAGEKAVVIAVGQPISIEAHEVLTKFTKSGLENEVAVGNDGSPSTRTSKRTYRSPITDDLVQIVTVNDEVKRIYWKPASTSEAEYWKTDFKEVVKISIAITAMRVTAEQSEE